MDIPLIKRQLYPDELRILKAIKKGREKDLRRKLKYHLILYAALIAAGFGFLASIVNTGFLRFLFDN